MSGQHDDGPDGGGTPPEPPPPPPPPRWGAPAPPPPPPGSQPYGYGYPPPGASPGYNGLAIASLILGVMWFYGIGAILAIIFSLVAKRQIRQRGERGGALATAGLVLGIIGVVGAVLLIVLLALSSDSTDDPTFDEGRRRPAVVVAVSRAAPVVPPRVVVVPAPA